MAQVAQSASHLTRIHSPIIDDILNTNLAVTETKTIIFHLQLNHFTLSSWVNESGK